MVLVLLMLLVESGAVCGGVGLLELLKPPKAAWSRP
jgi:hypothetical protein